MGSQQSSEPTIPRDFQMQKYLNKGLHQNQILQIKYAFDSYQPEDGLIDLNKLKSATEQSQSKTKIDRYLGSKDKMNFDEFFALSKQVLTEERQRHPQLIIDKDQIQATCLFCPYAVDKKK